MPHNCDDDRWLLVYLAASHRSLSACKLL
jgi:hypothetical protein